MQLYSIEYPPPALETPLSFLASWLTVYLLLRLIPASGRRQLLTPAAFVGFFLYWWTYSLGLNVGRFGPYWGRAGLGDEFALMAVMIVVFHSFHHAERFVYWRAAFARTFWITFDGGKPTLHHHLALAETSAAAKPVEPDLV